METALKIFSWISIGLGVLAIFGSITAESADAMAGLVGGGFFLTEGVLSLAYIAQVNREAK